MTQVHVPREPEPEPEPVQVQVQAHAPEQVLALPPVVEPPPAAWASRGPQSPCTQRRPSSRMQRRHPHPRPRMGLNGNHHTDQNAVKRSNRGHHARTTDLHHKRVPRIRPSHPLALKFDCIIKGTMSHSFCMPCKCKQPDM